MKLVTIRLPESEVKHIRAAKALNRKYGVEHSHKDIYGFGSYMTHRHLTRSGKQPAPRHRHHSAETGSWGSMDAN